MDLPGATKQLLSPSLAATAPTTPGLTSLLLCGHGRQHAHGRQWPADDAATAAVAARASNAIWDPGADRHVPINSRVPIGGAARRLAVFSADSRSAYQSHVLVGTHRA